MPTKSKERKLIPKDDAAKDVERPQYVIDSQPARIFHVGGRFLTLELDTVPALQSGQAVIVTVMIQ